MSQTKKNDLREQVAALCHEQWSGWMLYLFNQCAYDGETVVIPIDVFKRWQRQMKTEYKYLSENEKESDRKEADRFIALIDARWDGE